MSSYDFDELDDQWVRDNWPVIAEPKCSCWHSPSLEFFPEHCALPEHREAAREVN